MTLSWDYARDGVTQTAKYRGFVIRAEQDSSPENPFTSWGCEPPTVVDSGRRGSRSDYSDGVALAPLAAFSDSQVSRHWRAICKALNVKPEEHDSEARQNAAAYDQGLSAARRDDFESVLDDLSTGNADDYFQACCDLWNLAGVVAVAWSSSGYSQGDYATGLSVATPAWVKETGAPRDSHKAQCEAAGDLWGSWAWGDVYGYVIRDGEGDALTGEEHDSCWGFYGDDFAKSGLEEAAANAVDCIIHWRRKARQGRLLDLIRARVPLHHRAAILDSVAKDS